MTTNTRNFMMTKKDEELLETLKILKIMTSSQIERLFFSHKSSQCRRCKQLIENSKLKSYREDFPGAETKYYYKRKPTQQLKSMLAISELYVKVKTSKLELLEFQREYSVEIEKGFTIRPDARMIVEYKGKEHEIWVEVDNKKIFSTNKYYKAMKSGYKLPPIVAISDNPIRVYNGMNIIKMDLSLKKFDKFIEEYFKD